MIARRGYERRDHVAIPVTKCHDLVAFDFLVPIEADVIAALFRRCRRAVTVDHRDVQEIRVMKLQHRSLEDRIKTAICLPSAKGAPDPGVMNLPAPIRVPLDGQFLPLASQI